MQAFWFIVIAVLWAGFFLLEGFDFGVGMLLPFVGRSDSERRTALRSIGPVWDGNEVWLITAGGATFAAFPEWYASMFSGFYLAFAALLVGLILRGIGIEYRGKAATAGGRSWCDLAVVLGSTLPALLLGVAFANLLRGVDMDAGHNVTSDFVALLSPYALLGGLVTLSLFAWHGATFLVLRTDGVVADRARTASSGLGPVATLLGAGFLLWTADLRGGWVSIVLAVVIATSLLVANLPAVRERPGRTFVATGLATALAPVWVFAALWPDVMPARNNPAFSLTIHNASSSPYTLKVMAVVALVFTPIVVGYQIWTYWVFRARVTGGSLDAGGHSLPGRTVAAARASAQQTLGAGPLVPGDPLAGPTA